MRILLSWGSERAAVKMLSCREARCRLVFPWQPVEDVSVLANVRVKPNGRRSQIKSAMEFAVGEIAFKSGSSLRCPPAICIGQYN